MSIPELQEFVEWGGRVWEEQVAVGLRWLGPVDDLRVLEIGTRHGGMATFLAARGARVTALDISAEPFARARARAKAYGVAEMVDFRVYSGRPQDLPAGFDVVFSKSTLVLMGDLNTVAAAISASLVPGGRPLAVENARGPLPLHLLRVMRRMSRHPHNADYFTQASVSDIAAHLEVELERWTILPPTVAVGAIKP